MKYLLFTSLAVSLVSCVSQRAIMDSWMGKTKQEIIMQWGPPERTASDGGTGEILIWSSQFYQPNINRTTYTYKMMYVDNTGKIYHWLTQSGLVPVQQLSVDVYTHRQY